MALKLIRASRLSLAVLGVLLAVAGPAQAEEVSADAPLVPIPHPRVILLLAPAVHEELGLRPEQIDAVAAAVGQADQPLWRLRHFPAEKRNAPAEHLLEQLDTRLATILAPQQRRRLDQLTLQAQGLQAYA